MRQKAEDEVEERRINNVDGEKGRLSGEKAISRRFIGSVMTNLHKN